MEGQTDIIFAVNVYTFGSALEKALILKKN